MIVDASRRTTAHLACLRAAGAAGVIRYYARRTGWPEKRLSREEAEAIVAAGLVLGVVLQNGGRDPESFSAAVGAADAVHALAFARGVIGQPFGSAIYFAVDYHPGAGDIDARILPHFAAVRAALVPHFRVGVYGNGAVCTAVLNAGLADLAWLGNRPGEVPFDRWALRQGAETVLCGLPVDPNDLADPAAGFGAFARLDPPEPSHA